MAGRRGRGHARPWADRVPPELLGVILLQLNCLADRVCFAAVCRAWRTVAQSMGAPQHNLPWLLFPSRDAGPSFFSLHSSATRRLHLPQSVRSARVCGSHDGGWVAVAAEPLQGHAAVNFLSGQRVSLPHRLRLEYPFENRFLSTSNTDHTMMIRNIVFSASPTSANCLAAAHVSSASNIAFCQPGVHRQYWHARWVDQPGVIQDIIYHTDDAMQGFHVLTNTEEVLVYAPSASFDGGQRQPDAPLQMTCTPYYVRVRADYSPDETLPASFVATRYLAESRGKLLMVLRNYSTHPRVRRRTRMFRVFEMSLEAAPDGALDASWVELPELYERALFVGRGCSRAVEVAESNGRLKEDTIYYLDDTSFNLSVALIAEVGQCCRADMGIYRNKKKITRGTERFPREFTSDLSPAIWMVP